MCHSYYTKTDEPQHDKTDKMMCAQGRLRSAWASAYSDQSIHCVLSEKLRTMVSSCNSEDSDQTGQMPSLI